MSARRSYGTGGRVASPEAVTPERPLAAVFSVPGPPGLEIGRTGRRRRVAVVGGALSVPLLLPLQVHEGGPIHGPGPRPPPRRKVPVPGRGDVFQTGPIPSTNRVDYSSMTNDRRGGVSRGMVGVSFLRARESRIPPTVKLLFSVYSESSVLGSFIQPKRSSLPSLFSTTYYLGI